MNFCHTKTEIRRWNEYGKFWMHTFSFMTQWNKLKLSQVEFLYISLDSYMKYRQISGVWFDTGKKSWRMGIGPECPFGLEDKAPWTSWMFNFGGFTDSPHPRKQETRGLDPVQATSFFPWWLLLFYQEMFWGKGRFVKNPEIRKNYEARHICYHKLIKLINPCTFSPTLVMSDSSLSSISFWSVVVLLRFWLRPPITITRRDINKGLNISFQVRGHQRSTRHFFLGKAWRDKTRKTEPFYLCGLQIPEIPGPSLALTPHAQQLK